MGQLALLNLHGKVNILSILIKKIIYQTNKLTLFKIGAADYDNRNPFTISDLKNSTAHSDEKSCIFQTRYAQTVQAA